MQDSARQDNVSFTSKTPGIVEANFNFKDRLKKLTERIQQKIPFEKIEQAYLLKESVGQPM